MTEYERAMLLMQMQQLQYLHTIAWKAAKGDDDRETIRRMPEEMMELCGTTLRAALRR